MSRPYESSYKCLTFEINKLLFAVPIEKVRHIIPRTEKIQWGTLPNTPAHVNCVIRWEEQLAPIVDLYGISKGTLTFDTAQFIILLDNSETLIGLLAHRVIDIITFSENEIVKGGNLYPNIFFYNETAYHSIDVPALYKSIESNTAN